MPPKQRLSLVERQQLLLEEKGFAKPAKLPTSTASSVDAGASGKQQRSGSKASASAASASTAASSERVNPLLLSFSERHEAHLCKTGRSNAASASRHAAPMFEVESGEDGGDGASVASRASKAPSIHPSLAGSMVSMACSEATIGAGDDTGYWDFQHRRCEKKDLAHRCRECRMAFTTIGEPITERRGARTSMRYHAACFSGFADPRSQCRSSHHEGHLAGSQLGAAPTNKCGTKMRASCHFEGNSSRIAASISSSMGGKFGGAMGMGSNSFGSKSSKNQGTPIAEAKRAPGGFTEEELAAFNAQQGSPPPGGVRFSLASIEEAEAAGPEDPLPEAGK